MVLAEISIKLIFSQKERFAYELSLLQGYARKHVFLLSIYLRTTRTKYLSFSTYSLWIMDEGIYCYKISTNFLLDTWIVLSSIEFFLFRQ